MRFPRILVAFCALAAAPALAATGDLLVAPTRIVLDGARGTEVILNNIGNEAATYRISLELRRMKADGTLEEVVPAAANDLETKALAMISYAPRRIVLLPNQPQAVRIGIRAPQGLADGEYRAHMLFRAIPAPKAVTAPKEGSSGLSIALTPIYGITIPVIVRQGSLKATAGMSGARFVKTPSGTALGLTLTRDGTRSTYGRIRVLKPGQSKPVFEANGIAIYPEVKQRAVEIGLSPAAVAALTGPVTVQYIEEQEAGGKVMAELQTVLR